LPPGSLPAIIGAFKSPSTRLIRQLGIEGFAWQPRYYEHVVRNDASLNRIRQYIRDNPARWAFDRDNPDGRPDATENEFWRGLG
jgi:REP element-mobilizing transposase RayT